MLTWNVYEDLGGNLLLFVFNITKAGNSRLIYGSEFSSDPSSLTSLIQEIVDGHIDVDAFNEKYVLSNIEDLDSEFESVIQDSSGCTVVASGTADSAEFYYDRMGESAGKAFPRVVYSYSVKHPGSDIVDGDIEWIQSFDATLSNEELIEQSIQEFYKISNDAKLENTMFVVTNAVGDEEYRKYF